jgi:hypothetical protein
METTKQGYRGGLFPWYMINEVSYMILYLKSLLPHFLNCSNENVRATDSTDCNIVFINESLEKILQEGSLPVCSSYNSELENLL